MRVSHWLRASILAAGGVVTSCSAYFNPTVDLVLHVTDADAGNRIVGTLEDFARDRQLKAYPAKSEGSTPEYLRKLNEKTIYYLTGTRRGNGRSLTFLDATPACKVVRVVEGSERWLMESEADLVELRNALGALPGVTVEEGARFVPNTNSGRGINEYCPG